MALLKDEKKDEQQQQQQRQNQCSMRHMSRYQFDPQEDVIGRGVYGEVYKATLVNPCNGSSTHQVENKIVALKRTLCESKEEGVPASAIREVMVLKEISKKMQSVDGGMSPDVLGSENVVKLYDVFIENTMVYVATEYCEAGDLASYLAKQPRHRLGNREQYRRWMRDLLRGLYFLHRKEFSHRDLKPQNLVLKSVPAGKGSSSESPHQQEMKEETATTQYILKITDFGLSRVEGIPIKKYQHEAITLWYRSPDVLLGNTNYSYTADLWSAGCIIAEVASGNAIFRGKNNIEQLNCIFGRLGPPTERNFPSMRQYALYEKLSSSVDALRGEVASNYDSRFPHNFDVFECARRNLYFYFKKYEAIDVVGADGVDLLARLLAYDPKNRLTAEEALQHPFFLSLSKNVSFATQEQLPTLAVCENAPISTATNLDNATTDTTSEVTEKQIPNISHKQQTKCVKSRKTSQVSRSLSRHVAHSSSRRLTVGGGKVEEPKVDVTHDSQRKGGSGAQPMCSRRGSGTLIKRSTNTGVNKTVDGPDSNGGGGGLRNTRRGSSNVGLNGSGIRDSSSWSSSRLPLHNVRTASPKGSTSLM